MMSRVLPAHPNLDHLKNQAKDLLPELQRRSPGAKLAHAQHAIAQNYGFPSWPKLKAHVESFARRVDPPEVTVAAPSQGGSGGGSGGGTNVTDSPVPNYGFARYTLKAREALFWARYEAARVGSASIEPEHLLLGVIHAAQQPTSRIFERAHLSLEQARVAVAASTIKAEPLSSSVVIPFSTGSKEVFRNTAEEAERLMHHDIGVAHLLLGVLRDERSVATSILRDKGMRLDAVRDDIVHLLNEEPM
jgi:hypothetical protein